MNMRPVVFLGLVATFAAGDYSASVSAGQNSGTLRVETDLIQVNVVARDSGGRPVSDLTEGDFRLYDNGKRVPIDVFSAPSMTPTTPQPLPPNVFSNRSAGAAPSVAVILLDGLNAEFPDQSWARTQVVGFLENLKPVDHVAIFLLGSRLYVLQNFTTNPRLLLAALQKANIRNPKEVEGSALPERAGGSDASPSAESRPSDSGGASGGGSGASQRASGAAAAEAQMEQMMRQFEEHGSAFFMVDRVQRTTDALVGIANYLAHFPGRKNLIWVSASFPTSIGFFRPRRPGDTRDQVVFTQQLERAYKALNNADIAVYPVDARGLVPAPSNRFYSSLGTMEELAAETGGQAFYNTNDLVRPMQAAVEDYQADYTLGFYPHNIPWDGTYHSLEVKVVRRGVHLRYRRGYFATRETSGNETPADLALNRAIYAPLDSTGLGLTVKVLEAVQAPERRMELAIDMDAHDITVQGGPTGKFVGLAVVLAQLTAEGKVVHTDGYDMKLDVAAGRIPGLMKEGLRVEKWVDLVKGAQTLELVVRDPASGNIGSVRLPLGN